MNDYDPILFTQRQVFGRDTASGTLSTNDDYNEHIRPFGSPQPPAVEYDMLDYLTNGAGRYAIPAIFPIVDINTYTNPVVFVQPSSYNDAEPAIARINDIQSDSFSVYLNIKDL